MFKRRRQPTSLVGLELDPSHIAAAEVAVNGSISVIRGAVAPLRPGVLRDGEASDPAALAEALRELFDANDLPRRVRLGIANQRIVVRSLDLPVQPDSRGLEASVLSVAPDHIPMPMDEAVLDYVVLGPREEGSDLDRVLLVAAQKEMISRYSSAVRAAGLRPSGVDVKALSLVRSTLPVAFFDDEGAVLLLDIGTEITNLVVAQDGGPTLTRFIPGGSGYLAQVVAETADLTEEEAERQLMNPRVRIGPEPEEEAGAFDPSEEDFDPALMFDIRRSLEDAVQALAEDVQRSIEYHYSQPGAREVTRVFVSGEGALINGFDAYLGDILGLDTRRGTLLEKLTANKSNVPDEQLRVMEPVLAVSLGLALEEA